MAANQSHPPINQEKERKNMQLKHLTLFVDAVYQIMINDFQNPLLNHMVKRELNVWFTQTEKVVKYHKKQFPDDKVEDMEEKVALIYELFNVALNVPKEQRKQLLETFKELNDVIRAGNKQD